MDNYSYLKFSYRISTSDTTSNEVMIPVSSFKKLANAKSSTIGSIACQSASNLTLVRPFYYYSTTSVSFGNGMYRANSSSAVSTLNSILIPTKISGLK